jgi:hypothetical protein
MDLLGNALTTRSIQMGSEFTMEPYPSEQFGFIDDPDGQFGNSLHWTLKRTQCDGAELLLTLSMVDRLVMLKRDESIPIARTMDEKIVSAINSVIVQQQAQPHVRIMNVRRNGMGTITAITDKNPTTEMALL